MKSPFPVEKEVVWGDMKLLFLRQDDKLAWTVIPAGSEVEVPEHRRDLNESVGACHFHRMKQEEIGALRFIPMTQYHLRGERFPNDYSAGEMLRRTLDGRMAFQHFEESPGELRVIFADAEHGHELQTVFRYLEGAEYFTVQTTFRNLSKTAAELDMLETVSLGFLSLFHADDAPESLVLHRWRTHWSAEGRHTAELVEDLALEPSWLPGMGHSEKFGQKSTLVNKQFFPTVALEDKKADVCWGIQLATCAPWQLLVSRSDDFLTLSGGDPDAEFAGWMHCVAPRESYTGPVAVVSCHRGNVQQLLPRLTSYAIRENVGVVKSESDWPVMFNEYCSSWGKPYEAQLLPILEAVKDLKLKYFVLDAGWFRSPDKQAKYRGIGDWLVAEEAYPHGFGALMDKIRSCGMIPGIWFEFESVSADSRVYQEHPEWIVKFNGQPYEHGRDRYFLDFRKPEVWAYLDERVLGTIRKYNIGYIKVDYNATLHLADTTGGSPADGVREIIAKVNEYYAHLRQVLPELVIEICASGGYRLTAGWLRLGSMASFSDAHETPAIPIIAGRTSLLIPYQCSQVWATLRKDDSIDRASYLLAAGFLGRFCLSGDLAELPEENRQLMIQAVRLYQENTGLLQQGVSEFDESTTGPNWNHPRGYQLYRRHSAAGEVIVLHTFEDSPEKLTVTVPENSLVETLAAPGIKAGLKAGKLTLSGLRSFTGTVLVLK